MLKALMPVLVGAGIGPMIQNLEKLMKVLGGGAASGKGQKQAAGPQAAAMPAPMPNPQGGPVSPQLDPAMLAMLTQMLSARGGATA